MGGSNPPFEISLTEIEFAWIRRPSAVGFVFRRAGGCVVTFGGVWPPSSNNLIGQQACAVLQELIGMSFSARAFSLGVLPSASVVLCNGLPAAAKRLEKAPRPGFARTTSLACKLANITAWLHPLRLCCTWQAYLAP